MKVQLLFFARLQREIGQAELNLEVPDSLTVRQLADLLTETHTINLKGCMVAVNETYARPDLALQDGDEIAFLPPVAGGSGSHTESLDSLAITTDVLSLEHAAQYLVRPEFGAQAYFVGTVRSPNQGKTVTFIDYEGFAPMAVKAMSNAANLARQQHPDLCIYIRHRLGKLLPGEASILIGVASPHRRAALEACDFLIEHLKVELPVWKHEADEEGEHWVEGQTAHPTL